LFFAIVSAASLPVSAKEQAVLLKALAAVPLLMWIYLAFARGQFWRVEKWLAPRSFEHAIKRVAVVIPARNEADVVARSVTSLLRQQIAVPLHIILVDDGSTDGTSDAASAAAQQCGQTQNLTILRGAELQPGWTGKVWALSQGVAYGERFAPDYYLLTDADIQHDAHSVASLLEIAQSGGYDLTSFTAKLACGTPAEKLLIPAFVFFFLKLYPPAWIRSEKSKTAGAAGGCILIRPDALARIGGLAAIRSEIIDDCALAGAVKSKGGRIWLGLTESVQSIRPYSTAGEIGRMIARSAFNQLRHSFLLLAGTLIGLALIYVLPSALLLTGKPLPMLLGAAAWLLMTMCYLPMVRFYRLPAVWSCSLPLAAAFYAGATVQSAMRYRSGRGGQWKGRAQDVT
jgi:hopene-associated glycosyltransferase HpnB